jgi:hypothetical protein
MLRVGRLGVGLQALPDSYEVAMRGMQQATKQAINDGHNLLEIEFPTAGLNSVAGDAEGQNEMTYSLEFLRKFLVMFQLQDSASTTRVFFPDKQVSSWPRASFSDEVCASCMAL